MPRAECAADWPCEVLPRAVVVYRSYWTSLKGDRGMWSCESLRSPQRKSRRRITRRHRRRLRMANPRQGDFAKPDWDKQSERPANSPTTTGYLSKCSKESTKRCRVGSSLRSGFAVQGGDNSEQFPWVRPRSRRERYLPRWPLFNPQSFSSSSRSRPFPASV
jgi:hypothetical protein